MPLVDPYSKNRQEEETKYDPITFLILACSICKIKSLLAF